jgi:acyl carrier protein
MKNKMIKITTLPGNFQIYVKKPVSVKAVQIDRPFEVETLEGTFKAKAGDYLVEGVRGELYSCKKEIFEETYDLTDDMLPITNKIKNIIAEACGRKVSEIRLIDNFNNDLDCDDLDMVELIMELEEEFGMTIPDSILDNVKNVGQLINYVENNK